MMILAVVKWALAAWLVGLCAVAYENAANMSDVNWDAAQSVIGAIGLTAVWYQLRQSSKAIAVSQQTLEAENRAWIVVDISPSGTLDRMDESGEFELKVENIGNTPATFEIITRLSSGFGQGYPSDVDYDVPLPEQALSLAPKQRMTRWQWTGWENRTDVPPRLYVLVIYKDQLTNERRKTECLFWMGSRAYRAGVMGLGYDRHGRADVQGNLERQSIT